MSHSRKGNSVLARTETHPLATRSDTNSHGSGPGPWKKEPGSRDDTVTSVHGVVGHFLGLDSGCYFSGLQNLNGR